MIPAYKATLGYVPTKEGSRAVPYLFRFNTLGLPQISGDLYQELANGEIGFIQSCFIDNSLNFNQFNIRFSGFGQVITARSQTQGYYPLFLPNGSVQFTAYSDGNVDVPVIFANVFINPMVWNCIRV